MVAIEVGRSSDHRWQAVIVSDQGRGERGKSLKLQGLD